MRSGSVARSSTSCCIRERWTVIAKVLLERSLGAASTHMSSAVWRRNLSGEAASNFMQPATEPLAAIVSSNGLKDAGTRPTPFPSEGRNLGVSKHLGQSLGQARFIETQSVSASTPKRLTVKCEEGWSAAARSRANDYEFGVVIPEPDPPDKRKRPPRANREAPAFFGTWAAADSAYPNEKLRSSTPAKWGRP